MTEQWNKTLADSVHQNNYIGNDSFGKNNLPGGLRKKLGDSILQHKKENTILPQVIDPQSILRVTELYEELTLPKVK